MAGFPQYAPEVNWEVTSTTRTNNGAVPVITKQLVGHVDNSSCPHISVDIQLTLTTPGQRHGPGAGDDGIWFRLQRFGRFRGTNAFRRDEWLCPRRFGGSAADPTWQQQVLANGWGYAMIVPTSFQADNGAGPDARHHRPVQQGPAAQAG